MKRFFVAILFIISYFCIFAEYNGQELLVYYKDADGLKERDLKTALHIIIKPHTTLDYKKDLPSLYAKSDIDANGKIWDIYSTCNFSTSKKCGGYSNVCSCWNREHTVPKSWFFDKKPMYSDAIQVLPTDGYVNNQRSNYPYGECKNGESKGKKALGKLGACTFPGYTGTVFEPVDEYKGDLARIYFYFVTCYQDINYDPKSNAFNAFTGEAYPGFQDWHLQLMLKWHRQDPLSQKEIDRNNVVAKYQHNRNPFVDYPELVEHIWGNKKNLPFYFETTPIENIEDVKYQVISNNNSINIIYLSEKSNIILRDICGRVILHDVVTSSEYSINIQQGLYLLTINNKTTKVVVK